MSSKFNDLVRSGPGFSSGQISALGDAKSKLDTPDVSRPPPGSGAEAVPKGYAQYVAEKAAAAKVAKAATSDGIANDTLSARRKNNESREAKPGAKPPVEGHVARALHMFSPRKQR